MHRTDKAAVVADRSITRPERYENVRHMAAPLQTAYWFTSLPEVAQNEVLRESREYLVPPGGNLFRAGDLPLGWYGVAEGLLKWFSVDKDGRTVSLAGLSSGSWFGEASLIRGDPYEYNVVALRASRVLLVPRETCQTLWNNHPLEFGHALMKHLAERVNLFMAICTAHSLADVDTIVARTLGNLFHRDLHPGTQRHLGISQAEIANLCGISRQRCNTALNRFKRAGLLNIEYGGITVLNLDGLRDFNNSSPLSHARH